jgi:hypothetical protein
MGCDSHDGEELLFMKILEAFTLGAVLAAAILVAAVCWAFLRDGVPIRIKGPVHVAPEPLHLIIHPPERP